LHWRARYEYRIFLSKLLGSYHLDLTFGDWEVLLKESWMVMWVELE